MRLKSIGKRRNLCSYSVGDSYKSTDYLSYNSIIYIMDWPYLNIQWKPESIGKKFWSGLGLLSSAHPLTYQEGNLEYSGLVVNA